MRCFLFIIIIFFFSRPIRLYGQGSLSLPQAYSIELEDSATFQKDMEAQYKLGKYYLQCYNLAMDELEREQYSESAISLFREAALKGHVDAMYGLAVIYRDIYGRSMLSHQKEQGSESQYIHINMDSVKYWINKAIEGKSPDALFGISKSYEKGGTYMCTYTPKNKRLANKYYQMALDKGSVDAYLQEIVEANEKKDYVTSLKYTNMLVERNSLSGIYKLANAYYYGRGVAKNVSMTLTLWDKIIGFTPTDRDTEALITLVYGNIIGYCFENGDTIKGMEYAARSPSAYYYLFQYPKVDKKNPILLYWRAEHSTDSQYKKKNFFESAQNNYAPAMGKLALCKINEKKSYKDAYEWALKGSRLGDAFSQYVVGLCFLNGYGVPQDTQEAAKWFFKAAEGGCNHAQSFTATNYENGVNGFEKNLNKAIEWREKAANNGDATELMLLGCLYEDIENYKKAYKCYLSAANKATSKKDTTTRAWAQLELGLYYYYCYNAKPTSEDSLNNEMKALRFFNAAHNLGNSQAAYYIGECYEHGYANVSRDIYKAMDYYKEGAERGNNYCAYYLGKIYYEGKLTEKNYELAFKYLKQAAEATLGSIASAMRMLSNCYEYGLGTKEDKTKSKYWFQKAIKYNDAKATELMHMTQKRNEKFSVH